MRPRILLRAEGLVLLAAALGAYLHRGESLLLLAALALAPDLSMAAYLLGAEWGSRAYNAAHAYPLPAAALGAGLWFGLPTATAAALVWFGHIGADRALGYGLKYPTGFRDTHLGRV